MITTEDRELMLQWLRLADAHRAFVLSVHTFDGLEDEHSVRIDAEADRLRAMLRADRRLHTRRAIERSVAQAMINGEESARAAMTGSRVVAAGSPKDVKSS